MNYLFVNFKTYEQATGKTALRLAKMLEGFESKKLKIIPVVQAVDLREIILKTKLGVFAQHCDPVSYGSNTGHILPEAICDAGAIGTILNHAENKYDDNFIKKTVERCRSVGLRIMLCAESLERAEKLAVLAPDFLAIEPPELIGGNVSVSSAKPELISDSVSAIKKISPDTIVITGAGVKTGIDVSKAIELGTKGVFVASGIVCAKDQKKAVADLVSGFS